MNIKEIEAKTVLRQMKKIDSWFVSRYGMNLYRGCTHNCVYCDGRAEGYYVEGEFGKDVAVKVNAAEVLSRELSPKKGRHPLKRGFIMVGGGVGDGYEPAEEKYGLTRKILEVIYQADFPVHILTKSILVKKDIDILKKINKKKRAIVSFSFSSTNNHISSIFEPGVPSPAGRLETIALLKKEGIACGMFLMPVIPFITDTPQIMEESVKQGKEAGVDYIIFGGMTLKKGKQKDYFLRVLRKYYPELCPSYEMIYPENEWGQASNEYYWSVNRLFDTIALKYRIPKRIPSFLFKDMIDENDLVKVILEQMDYLLKLKGEKSPYGYAAFSVSKMEVPITSIKDNLKLIKGVGDVTERIILEILETGTSAYYEKLLIG